MPHILRAKDRPPSASRTIKFEGGPYGTAVSFFAVDVDPGQGARLHVHPYAEVWMVKSGQVRFQAGDEIIEGRENDIVVVEPNTPHGFTNSGTGRLEMMCIHDTAQIIQTFLDPAEA